MALQLPRNVNLPVVGSRMDVSLHNEGLVLGPCPNRATNYIAAFYPQTTLLLFLKNRLVCVGGGGIKQNPVCPAIVHVAKGTATWSSEWCACFGNHSLPPPLFFFFPSFPLSRGILYRVDTFSMRSLVGSDRCLPSD